MDGWVRRPVTGTETSSHVIGTHPVPPSFETTWGNVPLNHRPSHKKHFSLRVDLVTGTD